MREFPVAFGVHLLARRTQLILAESQAALELGISVNTYRAWEADEAMPQIDRVPGVIRFLSFSPYDPALPFPNRLVLWRSLNGVSQERFAAMMWVDSSTLAKWERGDSRPSPILRARISAARASLGDLGYELFARGNGNCDGPLPVPESANNIRIPKLTVGTIPIRFPPSLFVFYEGGWSTGRKLEAWRTGLGLSQRDFAKLTGFAHQSICRWEKGRRSPSDNHVTRIRTVIAEILAHI